MALSLIVSGDKASVAKWSREKTNEAKVGEELRSQSSKNKSDNKKIQVEKSSETKDKEKEKEIKTPLKRLTKTCNTTSATGSLDSLGENTYLSKPYLYVRESCVSNPISCVKKSWFF